MWTLKFNISSIIFTINVNLTLFIIIEYYTKNQHDVVTKDGESVENNQTLIL